MASGIPGRAEGTRHRRGSHHTQTPSGDARPMSAEIMGHTVRSAGWVFGWRAATRALGLISTLVLIRILVPQDFGLIALGSAFAQTVDALSVLGVEDALIRERQTTTAMYHTAFTMNLVRGLVIGGIVAIGSGPVAAFFEEPRLQPLLLVLAGLAASDGLINIGIVDFRRDFQFQKEFLLNILPRIASVGVTIAAALLLRSYWALLAGMATYRLLRLAGSYAMHPYRPRLTLGAWRSLLSFSLWTWVLAVLAMLRQRSDAFVIGRVIGTADVGLYSLGSEIAALPATELVEPLGRAAYSGFSALGRHGGAEEMLIRLLASALLVTLPIGLGVSLLAEPLVRVAMGDRWMQAVPLVAVLGPASCIVALATVSAMLLQAQGRLHRIAAIAAVGVALRIPLMVLLLLRFGLPGAAAGTALAIVVESALMFAMIGGARSARLRSLLGRTWRSALAAAVMAGALWAEGLGWAMAPPGETWAVAARRLCAGSALGAAIYLVLLAALWAAQGRPPGPERDMAGMLMAVLRRLRAGRMLARLGGKSFNPGKLLP